MKIKNKSWSQMVLPLAGGGSITLPARGSVEINAEEFTNPECQRFIAERAIIVLPDPKKTEPERGNKESGSKNKKDSAPSG